LLLDHHIPLTPPSYSTIYQLPATSYHRHIDLVVTSCLDRNDSRPVEPQRSEDGRRTLSFFRETPIVVNAVVAEEHDVRPV
jgi:hypothetical protein